SVLWGFISQYAPEATPENAAYLDHMTSYAVNYYNDFVKSKKDYLIADEKHKILLKQISDMLGSLSGSETGEEIQNEIYAIGREAGYENLRDFFKEIYQILLGQTQGPRLGSFFKLYGIADTIKLIESKIS
ncbi:MAG: lysine--tRNA ligase, partial [Pseudomonadota bacterium]